MSSKAKILYVEDDESLSFVTRDNLERNGYNVVHYMNGEDAWNAFADTDPDICILDVMLPKMDGFTLATKIREVNDQVPIIFLTARSMKEDKIHGLKLGGDDYIIKPFSIEEIELKIEIFLKRSGKAVVADEPEKILIGAITFDHANHKIIHGEEVKNLTLRESELLLYLCKNKNQIVEREEILEAVWKNADFFISRSLDVFISKLRKYLKSDENIKIENIHGVGFRLQVNEK